ncbi:hypothetical protein [Pseudomonas viridiflava]|uniref:hypothetical protein n=1 Tax=Pseudomonas viridiflava TaxID=33069 RepID=UPI000F0660E4|nr:hypothetical protein [Pseudomonas viridiflava]
MFEPVATTVVLLFFSVLAFFTFYAPVRTAVLLIRKKNPLDRVSRLSYGASMLLSFPASGFALIVNVVPNSKYSDYTNLFLSISAYFFVQAVTMAVLMGKTRVH